MAGKDLTYRIGIDASDATGSLQRFGREVKGAMRQLEDGLGEGATAGDKLSVALDQLTAQMKEDFASAAIAAEEMGRALKEAGSTLDAADVVTELGKMGISFDEMTADADKLAASLKQLDDVKMDGVKQLDAAAPGLATKLDAVSKSADSSRSVLANMVGNATQDIGALAGVAGSAGVALGQMGEYMADAKGAGEGFASVLGNFGKVAGPLAAIGVATQAISTYMGGIKAEKAFRADLVDNFSDSIRDADTQAEALLKTLKETGDIEFSQKGGGFLGLGTEIASLLPIIETLGYDWDQVISDMQDPGAADRIGEQIRKMTLEGGEGFDGTIQALQDYKAGIDQYGDAWRESEAAQEIANRLIDDAGESATNTKDAIKALADLGYKHATAAMEENIAVLQQWAEEALRAEEGAAAFTEATGSDEWEMAGLAAGVSAMGSFNDMLFANDQQIIASEEAFKALNEAVKENGANFDVTTEAGRANQSALEGVARALEDDLAVAYQGANGDQDAFEQTAGKLAHDTLARLQSELGLSADETFALAGELGLLPEDIETRYELTGDAEAKAKLDLLQSAIDNLPKDVQATVTQQIIAGDYQGALKTVQDHYAANPASMIVDADIAAAQAKADEAQAYADGLVGTEAVDADIVEAQAQADAAKAYADSLEGSIGVDGDAAKAKAEADAAVAYANRLSGTVTINATKGTGWDSLRNFFAGGITATVNARPGGTMAAPATAATGPTVGPTALVAAPTSTPGVTPLAIVPVSAAAVQVAAIWEDILHAVNRLGTLTEEGNDTAELAARSLKAVNLADVSAVQANRIGSILEQLNYETVAGNKEAMAALATELSIAVRELNPAAGPAATGATGEVVKPTEVKVKEDPNTPILLKISDTLLSMLSHDRTALAMTLGELNAIAHADQTAAAAHAAAMTIRAGAA